MYYLFKCVGMVMCIGVVIYLFIKEDKRKRKQ